MEAQVWNQKDEMIGWVDWVDEVSVLEQQFLLYAVFVRVIVLSVSVVIGMVTYRYDGSA